MYTMKSLNHAILLSWVGKTVPLFENNKAEIYQQI